MSANSAISESNPQSTRAVLDIIYGLYSKCLGRQTLVHIGWATLGSWVLAFSEYGFALCIQLLGHAMGLFPAFPAFEKWLSGSWLDGLWGACALLLAFGTIRAVLSFQVAQCITFAQESFIHKQKSARFWEFIDTRVGYEHSPSETNSYITEVLPRAGGFIFHKRRTNGDGNSVKHTTHPICKVKSEAERLYPINLFT